MDADSQFLTDSLGWKTPDELKETLVVVMTKVVTDEPIRESGHRAPWEGVNLLPSNIYLSALELLPNNCETISLLYFPSL